MEMAIRQLCIVHFPGLRSLNTPDVRFRSLTARMWHARRQMRLMCITSVKTMFQKLAQ